MLKARDQNTINSERERGGRIEICLKKKVITNRDFLDKNIGRSLSAMFFSVSGKIQVLICPKYLDRFIDWFDVEIYLRLVCIGKCW